MKRCPLSGHLGSVEQMVKPSHKYYGSVFAFGADLDIVAQFIGQKA